jgi:hypothetical protein
LSAGDRRTRQHSTADRFADTRETKVVADLYRQARADTRFQGPNINAVRRYVPIFTKRETWEAKKTFHELEKNSAMRRAR